MRRPSISLPPPIWRESRVAVELASLVRDPIWRGAGVEDGDGQPVLLIPGFLAGDNSLGPMTRWLRRTGHWTRSAGIRVNVDCSAAALERLEERVELMAERHGRRVAIVGQSRGGHFARVLAVRRPDLVSGIVTLGSPQLDPLAVHPIVQLQVITVGAIGSLGAHGFFRRSCRTGSGCCTTFWEDLAAPFPASVGYLSIYSRSDGVVDWRACLDPAADQLEVDASHCGMSVNAEAYRAVADALARYRRPRAATPRRAARTAARQADRRAA